MDVDVISWMKERWHEKIEICQKNSQEKVCRQWFDFENQLGKKMEEVTQDRIQVHVEN